MVRRSVKIAYIGGGSKAWARSFMQDLALAGDLAGEVALYDIDVPAARRNQIIGTKIQQKAEALSDFRYTVSGTLESALTGADFVIIFILPGTFAQMHTDVHAPEAYGILQSVGDTVGPGGVFRALRTVPVYEEFAEAIRDCCPDAWVLNLTNPMSICVKTLYRSFPQIKAFGCCHEVFHTQNFLCCALAAAGDRHLVEFIDRSWYLRDRETVQKWHFGLTSVDWRIANQERLIRESIEMAEIPRGGVRVGIFRGEGVIFLWRRAVG